MCRESQRHRTAGHVDASAEPFHVSDDGREGVLAVSHKYIDVYTKYLITQLRENNVNLKKVYSIIGSSFGLVEKLAFTKRIHRNICGKISHEQADDNVMKTAEVFVDIVDFTYGVLADSDSRGKTFDVDKWSKSDVIKNSCVF